jgi:hypothetical protein
MIAKEHNLASVETSFFRDRLSSDSNPGGLKTSKNNSSLGLSHRFLKKDMF